VTRVREWREANPGYSRRKAKPAPLRDPPGSHAPESHQTPASSALQDRVVPLQDSVTLNALITGLISHIFRCTLQDDIESQICRLVKKGMEIHHSTEKSATQRSLGRAQEKLPITQPLPAPTCRSTRKSNPP
jgi:hypothetical protein